MISPVRVWFLGRTSSIRTDYRELRETIPVRRFGLEFRCIDLVLGVIGAPPSPAMSSGVAELFKHALFPFSLETFCSQEGEEGIYIPLMQHWVWLGLRPEPSVFPCSFRYPYPLSVGLAFRPSLLNF